MVYRAKFVPTVFAARQFVNHGHVLVNGKRVNIPSYRVNEGDVIEVREKSKQMAAILEASQLPERDVPDYIDVDHSKLTATFVRTPGLGDRALSGAHGTEPRHRILRTELRRTAGPVARPAIRKPGRADQGAARFSFCRTGARSRGVALHETRLDPCAPPHA